MSDRVECASSLQGWPVWFSLTSTESQPEFALPRLDSMRTDDPCAIISCQTTLQHIWTSTQLPISSPSIGTLKTDQEYVLRCIGPLYLVSCQAEHKKKLTRKQLRHVEILLQAKIKSKAAEAGLRNEVLSIRLAGDDKVHQFLHEDSFCSLESRLSGYIASEQGRWCKNDR